MKNQARKRKWNLTAPGILYLNCEESDLVKTIKKLENRGIDENEIEIEELKSEGEKK